MKGLEAVEVKYSEIHQDNEELRLDSDFFQKDFISNIRIAKSKPNAYLKTLISDLKSFGAYSLCNYIKFQEDGIPFIRCLNIKNGVINFKDVLYIDEQSNELLWKSEVKPRMVLVTMSGTVGNATVALEHWKYPMNTNQDIAKIVTSSINPFFLSTFLNTKFGLLQMQRLQAGAIQQHLYLSQIEKLIIPLFSKTFQDKIESSIKFGYKKIEEANKFYSKAENSILIQLNLSDWLPTEENTTVKKFSESIGSSGRLDAEFYQPKYDELEQALISSSVGAKLLGNCIEYLYTGEFSTGVENFQEGYVPYIINTFIKQLEINTNKNSYVNPKKHQRFLQNGEILTGRVGAIGNFGVVSEENIGSVCSDNIIGFKLHKEFNPLVYGLFFNSIICKLQIEKISGGSVQPLITQTALQNILIPVIPSEKQNELNEQIQLSFKLKQESSYLIEIAKQAVEMAIEKDEATALNFIKEKEAEIN